jgi:uncharacterized repeat protein (TIGR01451 family)
MKKILFTLVCLVWFSCLGFGQWEKVSFGNYKISGTVLNSTFYKDTIIIRTYGNDAGRSQFYYTINYGKNWTKIIIPEQFKNEFRSTSRNNQICMNQYGLFCAVSTPNSTTTIYNSKDLGKTWNKTTFSTPKYVDCEILNFDSLTYLKVTNSYLRSNYAIIYKYINNKWVLYLGEPNYYNLSKNRFVIDSADFFVVYDAETKSKLKKIEKKQSPLTSTFSQDSTIVLIRLYSENDTVFVSKNFGLSWSVSIFPNSTFSKDYTNVIFNNNYIYLNGRGVYLSKDFGQTWKSMIDSISYRNEIIDTISNYSGGFINVFDSTLLAHTQSIFIKRQEDNWKLTYTQISDIRKAHQKINDSIYSLRNNYYNFISKDKGLSWQGFSAFSGTSSRVYSFNSKLYSLFSRELYSSIDYGKSWVKDTVFPLVSPIIGNDTILFKEKGKPLQMFTKPYVNGQDLPIIDSIEVSNYDMNSPNHFPKFSEGFLFVIDKNNNFYRYKIKDGKKDLIYSSTKLRGFIVNKNKIWLEDPTNFYSDSILFSNDYGNNWTKFKTPNKTFSLIHCGNYLVTNTFYLYPNSTTSEELTQGIHASADDGKSWFPYNKGIRHANANISSFYLFKIDTLLFLQTQDIRNEIELWRLGLKDLNLKSISGNIYHDINRNGIKDLIEKPIANAQVTLPKSGGFAYTDSLGNYSMLIDLSEKDTLRARYNSQNTISIPNYYILSQSDTIKNFGLYLPANDLKVNIVSITPPRPGFKNNYQINYKNIGSATANGSLSMTYNAKQTFVEATTAPTSNTNQTLVWNYTNLQPNESRVINLTLKTAVDAPIRTAITHVATIDPLSIDTFKTDNVDSLVLTVVGSYDPNDKQVTFNNSKSAPAVIDNTTELTYTIRFQNTGNYPADFVKVSDTLSVKLDISTLRIIATSHKYDVSLKNKNVLTFDFNPIFLPDSTSNEKDSHGFIKFAIKPKKTLTKDEVIKNTAYIFFDYNPAIITNTVESANQKANSLFTPSVSEPISVYPNPTTGLLTFKMDKHLGKEIAVSIYSIDGKLMINKHQTAQSENTINGEMLHEGLYILQIKVGDAVMMGKFLVQK